jgi:hypothetical protein
MVQNVHGSRRARWEVVVGHPWQGELGASPVSDENAGGLMSLRIGWGWPGAPPWQHRRLASAEPVWHVLEDGFNSIVAD